MPWEKITQIILYDKIRNITLHYILSHPKKILNTVRPKSQRFMKTIKRPYLTSISSNIAIMSHGCKRKSCLSWVLRLHFSQNAKCSIFHVFWMFCKDMQRELKALSKQKGFSKSCVTISRYIYKNMASHTSQNTQKKPKKVVLLGHFLQEKPEEKQSSPTAKSIQQETHNPLGEKKKKLTFIFLLF